MELCRRIYLTAGLHGLFRGAVIRLTGRGGPPVVDLQTNFGGGKTHSMIALYHLCSRLALDPLPPEVQELLDLLSGDGVVALHDRRILGTRANTDHVAVTPSGVWVIDAKWCEGLVAKKDVGGWFSTDERLFVGRRDCSKLIEGTTRQVKVVSAALGLNWAQLPVYPLLCFVGAEWGWFAKPFVLGVVTVAWPKATAEILRRPGLLSTGQVREIADHLGSQLPPASQATCRPRGGTEGPGPAANGLSAPRYAAAVRDGPDRATGQAGPDHR